MHITHKEIFFPWFCHLGWDKHDGFFAHFGPKILWLNWQTSIKSLSVVKVQNENWLWVLALRKTLQNFGSRCYTKDDKGIAIYHSSTSTKKYKIRRWRARIHLELRRIYRFRDNWCWGGEEVENVGYARLGYGLDRR